MVLSAKMNSPDATTRLSSRVELKGERGEKFAKGKGMSWKKMLKNLGPRMGSLGNPKSPGKSEKRISLKCT